MTQWRSWFDELILKIQKKIHFPGKLCSAHFVIGDGAVVIICAYAPGHYAASQAKKISEENLFRGRRKVHVLFQI